MAGGTGQVRIKQLTTDGASQSQAIVYDTITGWGPGTVGGSPIAPVLRMIPVFSDIPLVTSPAPGTIGSLTSVLSFPKSGTTGQKFEFEVPEDYDSGDIQIIALYSMSTAVASPNNQIRIQTQAELARVVTGVIDSATYPATGQNVTTPQTTNVTRQAVLTLTDGTFDRGDGITVSVQRLPTNPSDLHTGAWQLIGVGFRYTSRVATAVITQMAPVYLVTANPPPVAGLLGASIKTLDFSTSIDQETKIEFVVPDQWDGSPASLYLDYAMGSASAGKFVEIETQAEIADPVGGSVTLLTAAQAIFAVPTTTNPTRTQPALAVIPGASLVAGAQVTIRMTRITAVANNHPSTFRLINSVLTMGQVPSSGIASVTEAYLTGHTFGNITGTVTGDVGYPNFATEFETYFTVSSTTNGAQLDTCFSSRLGLGQTTIAKLRIFIKKTGATPQYRLRIYAEGSGNTPVYDSGLVNAPAVQTELTVLAAQISPQPTGSGRFHIVVESHLDNGDTIFFGYPFVRVE